MKDNHRIQMNIHFPKRLALIQLLTVWAGVVNADFTPIPLTTDSYNQDIVVERAAPAPLVPVTTASMDSGVINTGFSWYERGYNSDWITTGLPVAGSLLTSDAGADHQYRFAASYAAKNAVLIDSVETNATLTLAAPQACANLSFLNGSGGGDNTLMRFVVHHLDGSAETGSFISPNCFGGVSPAWTANGRVNVRTFTYDSVNSDYPRLYSSDITVSNATSPVVSIDLQYVSGFGHSVTFAVSGAISAGGPFLPIPLEGYNEDMVVEASAVHPGWLDLYTTATMDNGTANSRYTWYEQGYYPLASGSGLPAAGSMVTNQSAPNRCYLLAPNYTNNNAVLIDAIASTASLSPSAPCSYSALSFLTASGHGPVTNMSMVSHLDGTSETNTFISPDWSSSAPPAFTANGRVSVSTKLVDSVNEGSPKLFAADVPISNTSSPITNIVVQFLAGGNDSHAVVFGVSGADTSVPSPVGPKLSICFAENGKFSLSTTRPGRLQSTRALNGNYTQWQDEGLISEVAIIALSPSEAMKFYRVLAQ
jgi:hypothetical protein